MRLFARGLLVSAALWAGASFAAQTDKPTIAVLDFELQDDTQIQGGPTDAEANARRLKLAADTVRQALTESGAYKVVDLAPADELIRRIRATQRLDECNGCELDIARRVGADRVLVGWVQKVSNLIININAAVKDVATGRTLKVRSTDVRGNTDESWRRGAARLARDLADPAPRH